MPTISAPGTGSGLDVSGIVASLVQVEGQGEVNQLNRSEARTQATLTAVGSLKAAVSDFKSSISSLNTISNYRGKTITSSDKDIITVSTTTAATPAEHIVQVSQLAKAHVVKSQNYINSTDEIGSGKITFQYGSADSPFAINGDHATDSVTILSSENTLVGIRDKINAEDIGVTASIVNDGTNNVLVFSSKYMGSDGSIKVSIDDDDLTDSDNGGLSELLYDPDGTQNMTQAQTGQSATVLVNGISVSANSNVLADVIEGVTMTLVEADAGVDKKITITNDTSGVKSKIEGFITDYNVLVDNINIMTSYDPDTGEAGLLLGDTVLQSLESQIRTIFTSKVPGLYRSNSLESLSDIGILTDSEGKMVMSSSTKLDNALANKFNELVGLFAPYGDPTNSLVTYDLSTDDTEVDNYGINITTVGTQGTLVGTSAIASLVISSSNDRLQFSIDNVTSSITIPEGTYASNAALANEIKSQINGNKSFKEEGIVVDIIESAGVLTLTSTRYGSSSNIEITGGDGKTNLIGAGGGTKTDGVDVEGTIGGTTGTGSGRFLTGAGDAKGLKIEIKASTTGEVGAINFTRGVLDQAISILDNYLDDDGIIEQRLNDANNKLDDIADDRSDLTARLLRFEERMLRQFTALDVLMQGFSSVTDQLTNTLKQLPGSTRQK